MLQGREQRNGKITDRTAWDYIKELACENKGESHH